MKKSKLVPNPSSPRESQPDDLDTVLVVSSDEIVKARAAAESLTSETATIDCHPVILDDSEEDTDRFVGNDASSTGLIAKKPGKPEPEREPDTTTISVPKPLPTLVDDEDEIIEISASGLEPEIKAEPKEEPRATITEVREVEPLPEPRPSMSDEATEQKEIRRKARFDDETKPIPKPDLVDIAGAMETVPLNSALVQNVLAQVDARAAARAAGRPVPQFQLPPAPAAAPIAQPPRPVQHAPPPQAALQQPRHHAQMPVAAPRRIGIEILITLGAFLFVAVPALYWLYVSFAQ